MSEIAVLQDTDNQNTENELFASLEQTAFKLQVALQPFHSPLLFSFGALACFYGEHFTYSIFFWQAFRTTGWPPLWRAAREIRQRCSAATSAAKRELPGGLPTMQEAGAVARESFARLQALRNAYASATESGDPAALMAITQEIDTLQRELGPTASRASSALTAVSAELEPQRLMDLASCVQQSVHASLQVALTNGAVMAGMSPNAGSNIACTVNRAAVPHLQSLLDWVAGRCGHNVQALRNDENASRWLGYGIRAAASSVGIAASFMFERLLFTVSNARIGAELMAREVVSACGNQGNVVFVAFLAEWCLFAAGLYFQFVRGSGFLGLPRRLLCGGPSMHFPLRFILACPLTAETWLQAAVAATRVNSLG